MVTGGIEGDLREEDMVFHRPGKQLPVRIFGFSSRNFRASLSKYRLTPLAMGERGPPAASGSRDSLLAWYSGHLLPLLAIASAGRVGTCRNADYAVCRYRLPKSFSSVRYAGLEISV